MCRARTRVILRDERHALAQLTPTLRAVQRSRWMMLIAEWRSWYRDDGCRWSVATSYGAVLGSTGVHLDGRACP